MSDTPTWTLLDHGPDSTQTAVSDGPASMADFYTYAGIESDGLVDAPATINIPNPTPGVTANDRVPGTRGLYMIARNPRDWDDVIAVVGGCFTDTADDDAITDMANDLARVLYNTLMEDAVRGISGVIISRGCGDPDCPNCGGS